MWEMVQLSSVGTCAKERDVQNHQTWVMWGRGDNVFLSEVSLL